MIGIQWKITKYGVECHEQDYSIPWRRLLETTQRNNIKYYDWPVHLAEKIWIDIHDFCDVFLAAIHDPRAPDGVNLEMATRSFSYAKRSIAERRKIYGVPSTIPFPVSRTLGGEG